MDKDLFGTEVYNKITEDFLVNIKDEEKENFKVAYLKYLSEYYDKYFSNASSEAEYNKWASVCERREKVIHLDLDENAKRAFLFPDPVFLELENLSLNIFNKAMSKKLGEEYSLEMSLEEYENKLNDLMSNVSDLFKYSAERVLSEAMMNLYYLSGKTKYQSFRLADV